MRYFAIVAALLSAPLACAQISIQGATNGANFTIGLPARGGIGSLFVLGLNLNATVEAATTPLPTELAGVRVTVGGAPAPLFGIYVSRDYQQINLQVPQQAQFGPLDVEVTIEQAAQRITRRVGLRPSSPGEFFALNNYFVILQRAADYSLITTDNPARPGDTLIAYLTGMPPAKPAPPDGQPAAANPLSIVPAFTEQASADAFYILIDGREVTPLFVGLTPGLIGVNQINFTLPPGLATGNHRIALERISCVASAGASCLTPGGGTRVRYNSAVGLFPAR